MKKKFLNLVLFLFSMSMPYFALAQSSKLSSDDYYRLAKIEGNQKQNFGKAAEYCKKGLAISPNNYDIREYLGKCYLELKSFDSARFQLQKVILKNPRRVDALHYLINLEYQTNRYSSAVCHINSLLEIKPYDKDLWLKKLTCYNDMGNKVEARRELNRIYTIFPNDPIIREYYRNVMLEEADKYAKSGDYKSSGEVYNKMVTINPNDIATLQKQINNEIRLGKKSSALDLVESGLIENPVNPALVRTKIGLLQEMQRYPEAISYTENILKRNPSATLRAILEDLKLESARFYNNTDPYVLYSKIYETNPGNEEAFTYLLNNSISKGYYADAQDFLSRALKSRPNDKNLLLKQLNLYELLNQTSKANNLIEKLATRYPSDADLREKYVGILLARGKDQMQDQNYTEAYKTFSQLTQHPDMRPIANEYLYAIQLNEKKYDDALNLIDNMIAINPGNANYRFKRAGLLEEMKRYPDALEAMDELYLSEPDNEKYKSAYLEQSVGYVKNLMQSEKYDTVLTQVDKMLAHDSLYDLAYHYGVNAAATQKNIPLAVNYCDRAIAVLPEPKDYYLKKAGIYSENGMRREAIVVLNQLHTLYPYNDAVTKSLSEEYLLQGKEFERDAKVDSAFTYYTTAYDLNPTDTFALYRTVNIQIASQAYNIAKYYADKGLELYPDNKFLLAKKGVIFENLQQYDSAYYYLKLAEPPFGYNEAFRNYMDYLDARRFKNQIGISFTRAYFDSTQFKSAIASIEFTRFEKNNTYTGRIYYAARPFGTGLQSELEWFHKFNKKLYTQANFAFSNQIAFPTFRLSASAFKGLPKDYEAELGFRIVKPRSNPALTSLVLGMAKTWEDVWFNIRVFPMTDFTKWYQAVLFQSRYYFNFKNDYLTIMGSLGTPPEDKTLDFQLNTFLTYTTRMVGAGYEHKIKHRTTIGVLGNWYNFRVSETLNVNQYNLFIRLLTLF